MINPKELENQMIQVIAQIQGVQKAPIVALKGLLDQRKKLDQQLEHQIEQIRLKYKKFQDPIVDRTNQIVAGNPIVEKQIEGEDKYFNEVDKPLKTQFLKGKQIERYWLTCLQNSKIISIIQLNQLDLQVLSNLISLKSQEHPNKLSITLGFKQNAHISNKTLTRHILVNQGLPVQSLGDAINWKIAKPLKRGHDEQQGSGFLQLFQNKKASVNDEKGELQIQYNVIAEIIQQIIPYSLQYYMGVAQVGQEELQLAEGDQSVDEQGQSEN